MGLCTINNYWAVDSTPIYTPSTFKFNNSCLLSSDSKRVESGKYYLTWVRRGIRVMNITYSLITAKEVSFLRDLMFGKEFQFTFFDNGIQTIDAFATKDSYSAYLMNEFREEGGLYKNYTIEITMK